MASIAITGARGRLGSCFRSDPEWLRRHTLTAFSRSPGDSLRSCDELFDPGVVSGFDILLHLAWSSVPKTAEADPGHAEAVDLPLLEQILESVSAAGEGRQQPIRFGFFSTGAIYGNARHDSGSVETDPAAPVGAYARGKREAEKLIDRFVEERGLCATILRVSNAWGFSGDSGPPQGVIPHLIRASLDGTAFEQWGGDSEKDYLHVDDLSRALLALFEQKFEGLFNVAAGHSHRLSELIAAVEKATRKPIRTEPGGELSWDVSRNRISPKKFHEATGWDPRVDLQAGIARMVEQLR